MKELLINGIKISESFIEHMEKAIESHHYNVKYFTELSRKYKKQLVNQLKRKAVMQRKYLQAFGKEEIV